MVLNNLKNFWRKNLNVKIFNLAVIPDNINQNKMQFFYCQEDAPNYQIFSNSKSIFLATILAVLIALFNKEV